MGSVREEGSFTDNMSVFFFIIVFNRIMFCSFWKSVNKQQLLTKVIKEQNKKEENEKTFSKLFNSFFAMFPNKSFEQLLLNYW